MAETTPNTTPAPAEPLTLDQVQDKFHRTLGELHRLNETAAELEKRRAEVQKNLIEVQAMEQDHTSRHRQIKDKLDKLNQQELGYPLRSQQLEQLHGELDLKEMQLKSDHDAHMQKLEAEFKARVAQHDDAKAELLARASELAKANLELEFQKAMAKIHFADIYGFACEGRVLVTVAPNGKLTFADDYKPQDADTAAKLFWTAVSKHLDGNLHPRTDAPVA